MMNKYENRPFHVAMFVSRNKDNANVNGFCQRTKVFLTQKLPDELTKEFDRFVQDGVDGEFSRFYLSVNARKHEAIVLSLQHYLLDNPNVNLAQMDKLIASLSMKKGTAETHKFLFDYDDEKEYIGYFVEQVAHALGSSQYISTYETPNGYAVVTDRGFDTRKLLENWKNVELKRDSMLFITGSIKK